MALDRDAAAAVCDAIDQDRLLGTAVALVDIPSPTRAAAQIADHLGAMLDEDNL